MIGRALLVLAAAVCTACTSSASGSGAPAEPTSASPATAASGAPSSSATASSAASSRPPGQFTMSFAGDVHFMDPLAARLQHDPATVFGPAAAQLRGADLTMVNLETAITTGGVQQTKLFTFRAPPVALTALRDAGVDVATMANNHGADYGTPGLRDTFRAIAAQHFPVIGIGRNADRAFAPVPHHAQRHPGRDLRRRPGAGRDDAVAVQRRPAHPGVANAYQPRLVSAVRAAARAGDVVVVYLHWGIEYQTCPSADQTALAQRLAAAGASAVIGTHAHVLQGAGWLKQGTYVAYGLGNYLWWRTFGNAQDDNGVLTLTFHGRHVVADRFAPSHLADSGIPLPATGAQGAASTPSGTLTGSAPTCRRPRRTEPTPKPRIVMPLFEYEGKRPDIADDVFIAPTATVIGDVTIEAGASIWYGAVLRGDDGPIIVRRNANVQD